jgi:maltooligosyltrehalose trehalohydrolase
MEDRDEHRCGAVGLPEGPVRWRVWAPRARRVELVLIDGERRRELPMAAGGGHFTHTEPGIAEGQLYAYRLDGGPERPDPCSLWQPAGVHGPSAVVRPERFAWAERGWSGVRRRDLVFYELHVGTFTPEGTFDAVVPRLAALRELGVTALEVMPVGQFPGGRNWGYDGVLPYAVQDSYGGPRGLQRLVDACHAAGLAFFLDVVYNHLGPEGNYLSQFGPYFTDRYRTPWGGAFNYDDAGCDAVRDFVRGNVRLWLEDYRVDGLRLDAVHAIFDASPTHILREIKAVAEEVERRRGWPAHVVAESDLNDVRLLLPPEQGGHGLDGQWGDDFHHAVHTWLTGESQGYYADYGRLEDLPRAFEQPFLYDGRYSSHRGRRHGGPSGGLPGDRFVVCLQNHDQVGNRARGDRLSTLLRPPARRLAASLLLLSPHLPLLFMGEEYGEDRPFLFFCSFGDEELIRNVREGRRREFASFRWQGEVPDPQDEATFHASRLAWSWPEGTAQAGLRRLYGDLLAARRRWPALADFERRSARLLDGPVLELVRGGLRAYFNLDDQGQPLPAAPAAGEKVLFSSEASRYGGQRAGDPPAEELLPHECLVLGPSDWAAAW